MRYPLTEKGALIILAVVVLFFKVVFWLIFIRIVGSWIPELENSKPMQFVKFCTDPYLNLFRSIIPPIGMIDISPIVAIAFLFWVIQPIVINIFIWLRF